MDSMRWAPTSPEGIALGYHKCQGYKDYSLHLLKAPKEAEYLVCTLEAK